MTHSSAHNPALGVVTQIIILNGQLTLLYAQVHTKTLHLFFIKTFFKTQTQDSMKISTELNGQLTLLYA